MLKESKLRELLGHLVKEVMTELASADPMAAATTMPTDVVPTGGLSPVQQAKIDREKKIAARDKIKADQKMLQKVKNDEKSLKSTYDLTRRYTKPNLKKQIDAEKKAAAGL